MDFSATTTPGAYLEETEDRRLTDSEEKVAWIVFGVLVVALTYCYLNMLMYTAVWWKNPLYSHGYLVPAFSAFLFYYRYQPLRTVDFTERLIGIGILLGALGVRLVASYYDSGPFDRYSYVIALIGIFQIVGGLSMLRWAWPSAIFLMFMYPLPSTFENTLLLGLQKGAATASTWVLQLLGAPALRDGNRIMIDQLPLEVADACSGLRMVTIFGAMALAIAILIRRPWWDRVCILVMAIPIALVTNIIRITVTALLFMAFPEGDFIHKAVHDWAGFAMMPIALGLMVVELMILERITVPIEFDEDYAAFGAAEA